MNIESAYNISYTHKYMEKSSESIISHIPYFLDYCKEVGLSDKTVESYNRFLKKFVLWVKKENKNTLLPHELTPHDIQAYKLHLSHYTDKKGKSLKKVTQNYYLIALRAFLRYFISKDIESLPVDKIALPEVFQSEKTIKFLSLDELGRLLMAPNVKTPQGLRDRAILEVLISTGLKVNQLKNLNRDAEETLPEEALAALNKYIKTRHDKNRALFINYKGPLKAIGGRLSARSIENIVKGYGEKIGLPFSITPEILRWTRAHALANKEIEIQNPQNHQILDINNYKILPPISTVDNKKTKNLSSAWNHIENIISKEMVWLKENIPVLPESYRKNPPFLKYDDAIFRKIAILIVSGNIRTAELRSKGGKDLWDGFTKGSNSQWVNYHGKEWHRKMMDVIHKYFKSQNYKVDSEPILNYGRADLGIYRDPRNPLYIEVGTVSLFKLWYNLSTMKNVTFLVIPSENKLIEFNT